VKPNVASAAIGFVLAVVCLPNALAGSESGIASVYSFETGSRTASGEPLDPGALTAAHRTLPFGTKVRVTNKTNGFATVVIINDRGPFIAGRVIDVTPAAARALGFSGLAQVTIETLGKDDAAGLPAPRSSQASSPRGQ
jgi:rare lipoprotein A